MAAVGIAVVGTAVAGIAVVGTAVAGIAVVGTAVAGMAVVGMAAAGMVAAGTAVAGTAVLLSERHGGGGILTRIRTGITRGRITPTLPPSLRGRRYTSKSSWNRLPRRRHTGITVRVPTRTTRRC